SRVALALARARIMGARYSYYMLADSRDGQLKEAEITRTVPVAVGTTMTDRPPHGSVRARLRIRLLLRMSGVEASVRIRMQDPGLRNPAGQDRGEPIPTDPRTLATVNQDIPPQPSDASAEDAQLSRVTRNSMILVVAQNDLPKPRTDFGRTVMLPAL